MNKKIISLVILFSILAGVVIFKLTFQKPPLVKNSFSSLNQSTTTPLPKAKPIDQNSNLKEEIKKLTPENYSKDFKKLREEI